MGLIIVAPQLTTRVTVQKALQGHPPLLSTVSVAGALEYARHEPRAQAVLLCAPLSEMSLEEAVEQAQRQGLKVLVLGASPPRGAVEVTDPSTLPRIYQAVNGSLAVTPAPPRATPIAAAAPVHVPAPPPVVLLGASTGGPRLLTEILSQLPEDFPAAVVIAQHIVEGFSATLAGTLQVSTRLSAREAVQREPYRPAHIYLAPVGHHIGLEGGVLRLDPGLPRQGYRPSVNHLFESACQTRASHVAAAILTGMGNDGAEGLAALNQHGAMTIVQDPATATVASMPQEALLRLRPNHVLSPAEIPGVLLRWARLAQHLDAPAASSEET